MSGQSKKPKLTDDRSNQSKDWVKPVLWVVGGTLATGVVIYLLREQIFGKPEKERQPNEEFFTVNRKRYKKVRLLGKGGFGYVYEVQDTETNKLLALKISRGDIKRITVKESEILESLQNSDHIIKLVASEERNGTVYMLMEKADCDFSSKVRDLCTNESNILKYFRQMLAAVVEIHSKNIMHLDLKPENFLLVGDTVKLADFGIAKLKSPYKDCLCSPNVPGFTRGYEPPEYYYKVPCNPFYDGIEISPAVDVYALGIILFIMIFKRDPDVKEKKFQEIPEKVEGISPGLLNVLKQCLEPDLKKRITAEKALEEVNTMYLN